MSYYTTLVETTYPSVIGTSKTNYWKLANLIHGYGGLAILGSAYIFQLLATFGIAKNLNYLIWYYGVGLVGVLYDNVYLVLMYLAYNAAHAKLTDNTHRANATVVTNAMAYEVGINRPQWNQDMMPEEATDASQAEALYREIK